MNSEKGKKRMGTKVILTILIAALFILLINITLASLTNVKINAGFSQLNSDQDLICYWILSESANANVTWYRNGVANMSQNDIACNAAQQCSTNGEGNVPQAYTIRGDVWMCNVSYLNSTSMESNNASVVILNSPPASPRLYLQNGTETTNVTATVPEDSTTTINISTYDADEDSITLLLNDTTFCSVSSASRLLTCHPLTESHIGIWELEIGARDYASAQYINLEINVTPENDAPYFSPALVNKSLNESDPLNYTIIAADDESNQPYNFSMSTDLAGLEIVQLSNTSALIRFNNGGLDAAGYADRGNHTVNITVTDSDPTNPVSTASSFIIAVNPRNHPANLSVVVNNYGNLTQGGALNIYINATDLDNDTLSILSSNTALYDITYSSPTDHTDPSGISFAYAYINITNLTNTHVIYMNFTISVFDEDVNTTNTTMMFISNTNDDPEIFEMSNHAGNTQNNANMSNLTAFTGIAFSYRVNATDIDNLTYQGDSITYSVNDSAKFPINSSSGIASLTPSLNGIYYIKVTATDTHGATYNRTAMLTVLTNNNPYFNQNNITIQCYEYDPVNYAVHCIYHMDDNATDSDVGDYVAAYLTNSTLFTIGHSSGLIDFAANQSDIGSYPILVTINDSRGSENSTIMTLTINNTNNPPSIIGFAKPPGRVSVGDLSQIILTVGDDDLDLSNSYENLTINMSVQGPNISIITMTLSSETMASIIVHPTTSSDAGNYTINITVTDYYGNQSIYSDSIYVYNITGYPNITQITPHGTPYMTGINESWRNAEDFPNDETNITIDENSTYTFNQTSDLDMTYSNSLSYLWYYDNMLNSTSDHWTNYFSFYSYGNHTLILTIMDLFNKTDSFKWTVTVNNINRPPILQNPLENITINESSKITDYMTYTNGLTRYYDIDDDASGTGHTTGNKTSMVFNVTACSHATFTFSESALRIKTASIGECRVNFSAYDVLNRSMYVISNEVIINVTGVTNDSTTNEVIVPSSSSGGGGSSSQPITIPVPLEIERPKPLQIITPRLVTLYRNMTVKVPLVVNNTWNGTLEGISLRAYTNATNVTLYIDRVYFPRLEKGESQEVSLMIGNYKSEGHYEVQVVANVTNPGYQDIATIFVNSAEMKSEGEELENRISFARDLLSSNPECQELNELLNQAKKELANNNYAATAKIVDDVINGCKYLMSITKQIVEKPNKDFVKSFEWSSKYNEYLIIGGFALLFIIALYYIFKKEKPEEQI